MARKTSIDVYRQIEAEGLLSRRRWDVYDALFQDGPMTQMECCRAINDPSVQDRSFMPRFAELKNMNAIKEVGERECRVTGRTVIVWDVTDKLPSPIDRQTKQTRKELEEENADLRRLLKKVAGLYSRLKDDYARNRHHKNS